MVIIMTTKPIQTAYKGYNFRSRLEARWAVFFDQLNIPYEYEPEGYDLGNGYYYLPDFRIDDFFIEVKPSEQPTEEEKAKARLLSEHAGCDVVIVCGQPLNHYSVWYRNGELVPHSGMQIGFMRFDDDSLYLLCISGGYKELKENCAKMNIFCEYDAAIAARSARFEHGQSGATL